MARSRKRRSTREFLTRHPYCCFCGGVEPATTRDHVPSTQMFSLRRRPKGLEFPACKSCNGATGAHEQVAALISRSYPDPKTTEEIREFGLIMRSVKKHSPLVLSEMGASWRQDYDVRRKLGASFKGGAINAGGPLVSHSIEMFGVKLFLALHYEHTGTIVPKRGGVSVLWFTNWNRINNTIPPELLTLAGEPMSLQQGQWSVANQFEYKVSTDPDGKFGMYVATFRESFLIAGFVSQETKMFSDTMPEAVIYSPGEWEPRRRLALK